MKIIYGCYPSFFSRLIANKLVEQNIPITHIMLSTRQLKIEGHNINGFSGLKFLIKRFGYRYAFFQILCGTLLPVMYSLKSYMTSKKYYSFEKLCSKYKIQLIKSDSFNDEIHHIESPDIFISMCLDQKLSNRFFKHIKQLCVNIHPSDIPNFGGVEPIIQLLLSQETKMGITIHKMTEKLDDGEPLIRKYISINNKSYFRLMLEFIDIGINIITQLHLKDWNSPICKPVKLKHPYRSWPTLEELSSFSKHNSYIKIRDLFY